MFSILLVMKETRINPSIGWKDYIGMLSIDDLQFDVNYSIAANKNPKETQDKIISAVTECVRGLQAQYNHVYPSNVYRLPSNERELITPLMQAMNRALLGFVTIRPYCAY